MTIEDLIERIKSHPKDVSFEQVMNTIAEYYNYNPVQFTNGLEGDFFVNKSGENEGSCKIFAFAKMNGLTEAETLTCFGDYYRVDVLQHMDGSDHANVRTFLKCGWPGIHFEESALFIK